jgi:glutathione synthase/RimK-type ligase-like ATP-grasp enzyme
VVKARQFEPGQVLRAYVVDNEVTFWTERFRERYQRPADWIVNVGLGARYRFVLNVSDEIRKVALRAAEVLGARIAAVDVIRTVAQGGMVLEVDTDGQHMMIDRQFKEIKTTPVEVRATSLRRRDDR